MSYYVDAMEQLKLTRMKKQHPGWIWNRSDTHVFLSVPGANDPFKTAVEPGNSFSPGIGTYGVSTWMVVDGLFHAPELLPQTHLNWRFRGEKEPVLCCTWQAGSLQICSELMADGDNSRLDYTDYLQVRLRNTGGTAVKAQFYLALRSFGAAGGPIRTIEYEDCKTEINRLHTVYHEKPDAFAFVRYSKTGSDIGEYLKTGSEPPKDEGEDKEGWASAALEYRSSLLPGEEREYNFAFHKFEGHRNLRWLTPVTSAFTALPERHEKFRAKWMAWLPIQMELPDCRFSHAFFAQLLHMHMASVMDTPRISPVTYPIWWNRDACYQIVALDRAGMTEFADAACRFALRESGKTGFGMEGDGDAELIWALSEHYLLGRSRSYLEDAYPTIRSRADFILRMLHTDAPILRYTEYVTYENGLSADTQVSCAPSEDGLANGRMDGHYPRFFVNGFCRLALTRAALCAKELGDDDRAVLYHEEAERLRERLISRIEGEFGQNERDFCSALFPTGWAEPSTPGIRERFEKQWGTTRCPGARMEHERLWTYFEVGEAHNRLVLGERERVWSILNYFLEAHTAPGLYTYSEGDKDENSCQLNWEKVRGWDQASFVTPHGWTAAEMVLLLRDCLVREEGGNLKIGSGLPASWMETDFSAGQLPTHLGTVSFRYQAEGRTLFVKCGENARNRILPDFPETVFVAYEC